MSLDDNLMKTSDLRLQTTVIEGGYCVGCGACSLPRGSPFEIAMDEFGMYRATLRAGATFGDSDASTVCPFSDASLNETQFATPLYATVRAEHSEAVGYFQAAYAGYVTQSPFRDRGSSGGLGSWLLAELLRRNEVDGVIHVKKLSDGTDGEPLFGYAISRTVPEVLQGSKSRYYPVELSAVLTQARSTPGRYVVTGIPCFVKAIRSICRTDPILEERIRFTVGLVCGHLKSTRFAEMNGWQVGIAPGRLRDVDFRCKLRDRKASDYGVRVIGLGDDGIVDVTRANSEQFGHQWGYGFFKYGACDYCDDVFAETADVVVGDAWLPRYESDSNGTNILIVRSAALHSLIEEGRADGRLHLEHLPISQVEESQAGAIRHRRLGLSYRLHLKERFKEWHPAKRVLPDPLRRNRAYRRAQELRLLLALQSHSVYDSARKSGSLSVFLKAMEPLIRRYERARKPVAVRAFELVSRLVDRLPSGVQPIVKSLGRSIRDSLLR
jgi:coenzyme F420 hydrogenase subunit beta